MFERFIELIQWDDGGSVLIEPERVVAIQKKVWPAIDSFTEERLKGPRSFVFLQNSNIFFEIADTVENIKKKVQWES